MAHSAVPVLSGASTSEFLFICLDPSLSSTNARRPRVDRDKHEAWQPSPLRGRVTTPTKYILSWRLQLAGAGVFIA
jgi:hypothetical protein